MTQPAPTRVQLQIAIRSDFNSLNTAKCQANGAPRRTWSHHKIVLEVVLVAVIDQVDAGIDTKVAIFSYSGTPSRQRSGEPTR